MIIMLRLDREYFVLTPEDIKEVVKCYEGLDLRPNDEFYLAEMSVGKPLSNSFFIHEREEIRQLTRMGLNPLIFGSEEYDRKYYSLVHPIALQVEFRYLKQVAHDNGFDIPISVLILFSPLCDPINMPLALQTYVSINHSRTPRKIFDYVDCNVLATDDVLNDLPEEIVPKRLRGRAKTFYELLLAEEPQWKNCRKQ